MQDRNTAVAEPDVAVVTTTEVPLRPPTIDEQLAEAEGVARRAGVSEEELENIRAIGECDDQKGERLVALRNIVFTL